MSREGTIVIVERVETLAVRGGLANDVAVAVLAAVEPAGARVVGFACKQLRQTRRGVCRQVGQTLHARLVRCFDGASRSTFVPHSGAAVRGMRGGKAIALGEFEGRALNI